MRCRWRIRSSPSSVTTRSPRLESPKSSAWPTAPSRAQSLALSLAAMRLRTLLRERLLAALRDNGFDAEAERQIVGAIARGDVDPHSAAQQIVDEVFGR